MCACVCAFPPLDDVGPLCACAVFFVFECPIFDDCPPTDTARAEPAQRDRYKYACSAFHDKKYTVTVMSVFANVSRIICRTLSHASPSRPHPANAQRHTRIDRVSGSARKSEKRARYAPSCTYLFWAWRARARQRCARGRARQPARHASRRTSDAPSTGAS